MNYNEMDVAIREAEATIKRAEEFTSKMARFLVGRLRKVWPSILIDLSRNRAVQFHHRI